MSGHSLAGPKRKFTVADKIAPDTGTKP